MKYIILLLLISPCFANMHLWGKQEAAVNEDHYKITLSHRSKVIIQSGDIMEIDTLYAHPAGQIVIKNGNIGTIKADKGATFNILGFGFKAEDGLTVIGNVAIGAGTLKGFYADGTAFSTNIEHNSPNARIFLITAIDGDLNGDGVVNFKDFALLAGDKNHETYMLILTNWLRK